MSLKKIIRKVFKEEFTDFKNVNQLKRRTHLIDKSVGKFIKHLHPEYFETKQKYLDKLIELVLRDLHGTLFAYSDLKDEEWNIFKEFITSYITARYQK